MADLKKLDALARRLRYRIIETSHKTSTPHLGSCLSCADLLVVLYFHFLRIDPTQPKDPDRDRFILSKGHAAPALFQVLAMRGYYDDQLLADYGQNGSIFAEHPPTPAHLPGIEAATGSLGHGLPLGLGMAIAGRHHELSTAGGGRARATASATKARSGRRLCWRGAQRVEKSVRDRRLTTSGRRPAAAARSWRSTPERQMDGLRLERPSRWTATTIAAFIAH